MKQHIKKIQFLVIALFTIMLSSCSDDLYHQGSTPVAKNKTVSIEEFKRNTGLHNFSKTFKIPKDNTIAYRNADGSYELSDFDINFDYIKQVVVENKISYTFNIIPKIVTSKSIFNLVVYNHDGNWETSIIELIPTDENFDKLLAGIDNEFEGSIRQVYASRVQQDCNIIAYNVVRCIDPNSVKCRIECDKCADCLKLIFFAVCNGNDIVQPLYVLPGSSGGGSIGSGSGLSDPSGYIFDPNMYELGSKKYQQAKNAAEFWNGLSVSQQRWVYGNENENNFETYRDIIAYINRPENINNNDARNFAREFLNLANNEPDQEIVTTLINLSITTKQNGYFENSFDSNYYNLINPYTEVDTQAHSLVWQAYFSAQCAVARYKLSQEPGWNNLYPWVQDLKVYWEASKEMIHIGLEVVGLVPVVGEIADLANGVIYTIEGEGVDATLSFASAIPVTGWFAAGVKFAKRADGLNFAVKATNNLITFGAYNSKKFRQACGIAVGDATKQAHHLIPRGSQIIEHEVVQKAAKATTNQGFHIDQALNGIAVATWRNQPNHTNYNNLIKSKLDALPANLTPNQAYAELMDILNQAKQAVINNPNTHLNDLIF